MSKPTPQVVPWPSPFARSRRTRPTLTKDLPANQPRPSSSKSQPRPTQTHPRRSTRGNQRTTHPLPPRPAAQVTPRPALCRNCRNPVGWGLAVAAANTRPTHASCRPPQRTPTQTNPLQSKPRGGHPQGRDMASQAAQIPSRNRTTSAQPTRPFCPPFCRPCKTCLRCRLPRRPQGARGSRKIRLPRRDSAANARAKRLPPRWGQAHSPQVGRAAYSARQKRAR